MQSRFAHRLNLLVYKLRGRYFIKSISFRRGFLLFRYSCQHSLLGYLIIIILCFLFLKRINLRFTQRSATPLNTIILNYYYLWTRCRYIVQIRYIFGATILIKLNLLNQCSVTRSSKNGPLLSLFPSRIRQKPP